MKESLFGRPELSKDLNAKRFREFYYLDTELKDFCKKNKLNTGGDRNELINRVADFLGGGRGDGNIFVPKSTVEEAGITEDTIIEPDFVFGSEHSEFFLEAIGPEFRAHEDFLMWLEANAGKTYREAVDIWFLIHDDAAPDDN